VICGIRIIFVDLYYVSMKTIFITIFEGIEAKNILRTPIFATLRKEPDLKIVLFTKNAERAAYHAREFYGDNIVYEVVDLPKIVGWDKFFGRIKYTLLRTGTSKLLRYMQYEMHKNPIRYYISDFLNWLMARPVFVKFARFLDYKFVKANYFAKYFDKYKPNLIFLANLFDEHETNFLREAKSRGVKSVGLINSWDRITARSILRLLPDKLVVFNDFVKENAIRHNLLKSENVFVGGIPQYDQYFTSTPQLKREKFFKKIGVPENNKLLVYAPIGSEFSNSDWDIIDLLYAKNKRKVFGENVSILVRFPPNDFFAPEEFTKRPWMIYDYPGTRFSEHRTIDWDMNFTELSHLSDTLYYMDLIVCYASSISVDAVMLNKPVINIDFEVRENEFMAKSPTHYYKKAHYQHALKTGGIKLVQNEGEMIDWINKYLKNAELDKANRLQLAKEQCGILDGKSGERITRYMLEYLNK